jgi:hypothetical protein
MLDDDAAMLRVGNVHVTLYAERRWFKTRLRVVVQEE